MRSIAEAFQICRVIAVNDPFRPSEHLPGYGRNFIV
jgi:hypothetical protein